MEQPRNRSEHTGSGSSDGDSSPLIPLWQEISLLLLKVERLTTAAAQALQAGDEATAVQMTAEAQKVAREAKEFAERARTQ